MVNEVMLVGRLVRDPEVRRTAKGTAVAHFSLATNSRGVDDEGTLIERPEFHEVEAWARLAETVGQVLRQGKLIYLRGQLRSHTWEQDGHRLRSTRIVAHDFRILANPAGRRGAADGTAGAAGSGTGAPGSASSCPGTLAPPPSGGNGLIAGTPHHRRHRGTRGCSSAAADL